MGRVTVHEDGSCEWEADSGKCEDCGCGREDEGTVTRWETLAAWAGDWIDEWRAERLGPAGELLHELGFSTDPRMLTFIRALVAAAGADEDVLGWIGAGPLEQLVRDERTPAAVIDEVCSAALADADFRSALANTWLGAEVPAEARRKLASLGAQDRSGGRA